MTVTWTVAESFPSTAPLTLDDHNHTNNQGRTKRMQATARMASVVSSTPPARRRLIRSVLLCHHNTHSRCCLFDNFHYLRLSRFHWTNYIYFYIMIHTCFICDAPASVEVMLYDVYSDGTIFSETDFTCPYLCEAHRIENESSRVGNKVPRGVALYKYSNKNGAQGYTKYKSVDE